MSGESGGRPREMDPGREGGREEWAVSSTLPRRWWEEVGWEASNFPTRSFLLRERSQ